MLTALLTHPSALDDDYSDYSVTSVALSHPRSWSQFIVQDLDSKQVHHISNVPMASSCKCAGHNLGFHLGSAELQAAPILLLFMFFSSFLNKNMQAPLYTD